MKIKQPQETIDFYIKRLRKSQISIVSGWLGQIRQLLDESEDIAEFYDRLPEIYPELDPEKFSKNFNQALVAASLAGVYEASLNELPVEFAEPDKAEYQTVPFTEAIDFFNAKGNLDTDKWDDLQDSEHDSYFVSAGAKGALLQDLRLEVEKAIIDGRDREQFKAAFNDIVKRRGWDVKGGNDWRAGIIYQTNLRQAYGDGRCRQMSDPDVVKMRPYRMWLHGNSAEPRPTHIAMNGRVFRSDDSIANQRLPMSYGCRCSWVTLSERDLKRRGLQVTSGLNWGDIIQTSKGDQPLEIDKGFKNPCKFETEKEREDRKAKARQAILDKLPADIRRDAIREIAIALGVVDLAKTEPKKTDEINLTEAKYNQKLLDSNRKAYVFEIGEKLTSSAEKNAQKILDNSDVMIRVPSSKILENIISDRFKSQFETNTSKGVLDLDMRSDTENELFGYDKTIKPQERPIYGYMGDKEQFGGGINGVSQYGDIAITFKPSIKLKTTITGDDSLTIKGAGGIGASPLSKISAGSLMSNRQAISNFSIGDSMEQTLKRVAESKNIVELTSSMSPRYIEAQIHGGVKASDITQIEYLIGKPTDKIIQWAKLNGVTIKQG